MTEYYKNNEDRFERQYSQNMYKNNLRNNSNQKDTNKTRIPVNGMKSHNIKKRTKNKKKLNRKLKVLGLRVRFLLLALIAVYGYDQSKEIAYDIKNIAGYYEDANLDQHQEVYKDIGLLYTDEAGRQVAEETANILDNLGRRSWIRKLENDDGILNSYDYGKTYYIHIDADNFRNGTRTDEMSTAFNEQNLDDPLILSGAINIFNYEPTLLSSKLRTHGDEYPGETVYLNKDTAINYSKDVAKAIVSGIYKKEAGSSKYVFNLDDKLNDDYKGFKAK